MNSLKLENISVNVENKRILENINLEIKKGEVVVLMGPNGAGKSSISNTIIGNPKYKVVKGGVVLNSNDITNLQVNQRVKKGIFMTFQNPVEIPGVTLTNFLRTSYNSIKGTKYKLGEFSKVLNKKLEDLEIDKKFKSRFINTGFSGGEKKRFEILQLALFEPEFAILDEIDSGLDVDALKIVTKTILDLKKRNDMGILIITHYNKIFDYILPDKVYIMKKGKIVKQGDKKLAKEILEKGFN